MFGVLLCGAALAQDSAAPPEARRFEAESVSPDVPPPSPLRQPPTEDRDVVAQRVLGHLDGHFLATRTEQLNHGDGGQHRGFATQRFRQTREFALAQVAVHGDPDEFVTVHPLTNLRRLDVTRER